jgi:O-antigen ligase
MPNSTALPTRAAPSPTLAVHALGLGLVSCTLVFVRGDLIGVEGHFLPKEFALVVAAFSAAVLCAASARRPTLGSTDLLLAGFLALAVLSAAGAADNSWFALRALALVTAGSAAFWSARSLARRGHGPQLLAYAAAAAGLAAASGLLEAHGFMEDLSPLNRAPGGVMGNRNRLAHLLVLGLPSLALLAVTARSIPARVLLHVGAVLVASMLVLSRCRAAWIACALLVGLVWLAAQCLPRSTRAAISPHRLALLALALMVGAAAAVSLPNHLQWSTSTPHLDTLRRIAEYREGSGRGRLIQYANSLRMAHDNPLLGVGPGNWRVAYPRYASPGDPSHFPFSTAPAARLPSGDWIGAAAEYGLPALLLLLAVGMGLAARSWRRLRHDGNPVAALHALTLFATVAAMAVVGSLDSVLFTPAAAFLFFVLLGTLAPEERVLVTPPWSRAVRLLALSAVAGLGLSAAAFSGMQLWSALLYRDDAAPATLSQAVRANPGDYFAVVLLAEAWADAGKCHLAVPLAERALRLYPTAAVPQRLRDRCAAPPGGVTAH